MQTRARSVYQLLGVLAAVGWQTASAVEVSWFRQPGLAISIATNASASRWMIGRDFRVNKWDHNGKQFVNQNFSAARIAVNITDQHWLVERIGWRSPATHLPQKAREVAVGAAWMGFAI